MARVLFLVHRMPYPPNKGDKVRSYHVMRYLASRHEVLLGTFVDDPQDEAHVATVAAWCREVKAIRLDPLRARVASLAGLADGRPLTLAYYAHAQLRAWVAELASQRRIDAVVVFSSSMAQYAEGLGLPVVVDFVDVDSAKWADYAKSRPWPLSWLYRREAAKLLAYERRVALANRHCFFVTDKEVELFATSAPECAAHLQSVGNGVDAGFFSIDPSRASPYAQGETPIVFTGAMDYWPNEDAVVWFAREVLPALRARWPSARLSIVGRNPSPAVRSLASDAVRVTGTVDDVRGWLQHAAVVVAPLRLARGVQNKVLEAMAMGRPVVAAAACVEAIDAQPGQHLAAATSAEDYLREIGKLLDSPSAARAMGLAGRGCVESRYSWEARLQPFAACLGAA